jgi:hypothetical protein
MNKSNYDLVLEVFKSYEMDFVLEDFKNSFVEGENISREDYNEFCWKYVDDVSEGYYIDLNWKYIESDGNMSVYDEVEEEEEE